MKDEPRSSRPLSVDDELIRTGIKRNPKQTMEVTAATLWLPKSTVFDYIKKIGMISRCDVWVPHILSEKNLLDRVSACISLNEKNAKNEFRCAVMIEHSFPEKWWIFRTR